MPETRFNTLVDPLINVRLPGGTRGNLALPDVLAQLAVDDIVSFHHLRPHQTHAWHSFLVQLAAIALQRSGTLSFPQESGAWKRLLLDLTAGEEAHWSLVVADLSQPALLQPPVPEGSLKVFKNRLHAPDSLDMLVTSKNHDLKAQRIVHPAPDHWLFALLTLQTMEGVMGAGNYGIARMNKSYGNRPAIGFAPSIQWGPRFRRDVLALSEARQDIVECHGLARSGGQALLWLEPWDGSQSTPWGACDPFFIEICRRVRLVADANGDISALAVATKTRRIQAEERKGDTGDAWTPVHRTKGTALTVPGTGFSYRLMQELLFTGDFKPGAAQILRPEDGETPLFLTWAMVRGQGKTEGLHQRSLHVPARARARLSAPGGRAALGDLAKRRVDTAATVQKKVLRPALCALLQAGAEKLNFKDDRPARWLDRYDEAVNLVFFDRLWQEMELDATEAHVRWARLLCDLARRQLDDAACSAPIPAIGRYRAISAADRMFFGLRKKHFPELASPASQGEQPQ